MIKFELGVNKFTPAAVAAPKTSGKSQNSLSAAMAHTDSNESLNTLTTFVQWEHCFKLYKEYLGEQKLLKKEEFLAQRAAAKELALRGRARREGYSAKYLDRKDEKYFEKIDSYYKGIKRAEELAFLENAKAAAQQTLDAFIEDALDALCEYLGECPTFEEVWAFFNRNAKINAHVLRSAKHCTMEYAEALMVDAFLNDKRNARKFVKIIKSREDFMVFRDLKTGKAIGKMPFHILTWRALRGE